MSDTDRHRSLAPAHRGDEAKPDQDASGGEPAAASRNAQPGREEHPTTSRDTTEAEAYSQVQATPDAEHATNQTTDDSLRKQRSQSRS